jgi:HSP20 family protein
MAKYVKQSAPESLAYLAVQSHSGSSSWSPNTDVYETAESFVVRLEIAGIEKEDVEITLDDRLLIVRGYRRDTCRRKPCSFRQLEIDYGYFERRLVIPRRIDGRRAQAVFRNGFLHIDLPKSETAEPLMVTVTVQL